MIKEAAVSDLPILAALALQLWPEHTLDDLSAEFLQSMQDGSAHFFLLLDGDDAVGFAQCGLRRDYVEGTDSSPVGYLEGIFIKESHRRQGCARQLLAACENWARRQGCMEFASDCELTNDLSRLFHLGAGFEEANRIICFTKKLT